MPARPRSAPCTPGWTTTTTTGPSVGTTGETSTGTTTGGSAGDGGDGGDGSGGSSTDSTATDGSATDGEPPEPNVTIVKTSNVTSSTVNPGQAITFTLTVTNSGTASATNLTVTDVIDADITFILGSCTGLYTCNYDSATRTLTWTIPVIEAGQSITLSFGVVVG